MRVLPELHPGLVWGAGFAWRVGGEAEDEAEHVVSFKRPRDESARVDGGL